ncbi:MAG: hypothetical protein ACREDJ_04035, partial [Methylocella sp.]
MTHLPLSKSGICFARPPGRFGRVAKIVEAARRDGAAHVLHQILVIGEDDSVAASCRVSPPQAHARSATSLSRPALRLGRAMLFIA